nr:auxin response factor 2-like isoform X2 [Ipomoea batatas]
MLWSSEIVTRVFMRQRSPKCCEAKLETSSLSSKFRSGPNRSESSSGAAEEGGTSSVWWRSEEQLRCRDLQDFWPDPTDLKAAVVLRRREEHRRCGGGARNSCGAEICRIFGRTSATEFIIPYDLESLKNKFSIGMRFKMRFEGEEAPEQTFIGTIVGIEDHDPHKWPKSKWRCLKVQWDETSTISRPDRVSH